MFTRRELLKGFAALSSVALLAACQPRETPAVQEGAVSGDAAAPAKTEKTKIMMWHQWGDTFGMDEVQDLFNSTVGEEKGIELSKEFVAATAGTQASEKLMIAIVGGTPPDTYWFDRFLTASWAAEGMLMPYDDYMDADDYSLDDFIQLAKDESTHCGKMYSLGIFTDCTMFFWRKDHFREVGLDPERPPQNLAELDEYAELLTTRRSDGSYERMGLIPRGYHYGWAYPWLGRPSAPLGINFWDFDNNKAACDDPRIVECVTWMQSYAEKYDVELVDSFRTGFGGGETDPFGLGLVSMQRNGDWMLSTYDRFFPDLDFGTARIPVPEGLSESSCGGGWGTIIPTGCKHPDEVWEWIKVANSVEGMALYCELKKQLPLRKSVAEMPFNYADPRHHPWMEVLPNLWNRPAIAAGQVLWSEIVAIEDRIRHGEVGVAEGLREVNGKVDAAMADFSC
jgi:multiple sugar transport system substrate-binding protein